MGARTDAATDELARGARRPRRRGSRGLIGAVALAAMVAAGACAPDPGAPVPATSSTTTSTTPVAPRTVVLTRGPRVSHPTCTHPSCAYLDVEARGFTPNSRVRVECWAHLSGADEMYYAYTLPTDATGTAVGHGCWYGYPGTPAWVVVDGVRSNVITWWSGAS